MRHLKIFFVLFLLIGCNKVKKSPGYQRFLGTWVNLETTVEPTKIEFKNNGRIMIAKSYERGHTFKPNSYTEKISDAHETNGIFWDRFIFVRGKSESQYAVVTINPTNDTLYFHALKISNFIKDSVSYSIIMVKI